MINNSSNSNTKITVTDKCVACNSDFVTRIPTSDNPPNWQLMKHLKFVAEQPSEVVCQECNHDRQLTGAY